MRTMILVALLAVAGFAGCISDDSTPATSDDANLATESPVLAFTPEVAAVRDAILANGTVTFEATTKGLLPVADPRYASSETFEVEVAAVDLLNASAFAEIDGEAVAMPFVETYAGTVVGTGEPVAITLTESWVSGTVRVDDQNYRVRIGMDGNFPAGTVAAERNQEARMQGRQPLMNLGGWTFDKDGQEPHDCLSLTPTDHSPVVPDVLEATDIKAQIILDGDAAYLEKLGDHAFPMMIAMLHEVDAIYQHEVQLGFEVVGLHMHTDADALSDPADRAPLGDLADYWNARNITRDMVHLYTGLDSSYAQANCIGGAGIKELAYTFTTIQWAEESYGQLRHTQTYAHELGHILNAHHHYGNPAEGGVSTTIMHQGGQKVNPAFSTLSRDIIRGWAEEYIA